VNPKLALKASRLPVVPHKDGRTFSVGGNTDVYTIYPDMLSGELRCTCRATKACSHIMAARFHAEKMHKLQRKNA
jgi:hypothetical protein